VVTVLAILTWWLVGRTLRPVEAIRSEVAGIEFRDLDRRVPEPGSGDEIDRLAGTMNAMLERLAESAGREGRFVSDASHELRSPLTRLRAEVELMIKTRGLDPELASLHEEVVLMQSIVEDLLFLARADATESAIPDLEEVDLEDLLFEEAARSGASTIDVSDVSAVTVAGSKSMLRRAITNLVDNARRHARSRVLVRLTEEDAMAVLTISDDGAGIPEGSEEAVFERFTRLDPARTGGGSGLGLAIAREVAAAHGGTLRLLNTGEPGATFEMRLPLGSGS
jgi:signal transduction histidine kinase